MNYEENSFIMGVFLNLTCPSKWVLFQTFNTHPGKNPPNPGLI